METLSVRSQSIWAYLQLMRPANILTAWADILVGYAAAGSATVVMTVAVGDWSLSPLAPLGWLLLSTSGLYGGGVVFNDVFDAELDRIERPERPIPTGRATLLGATLLGASLLSVGVAAAAQVSILSAGLAIAIALAAVVYDALGKHQGWLGPLNMGLCRGGNLLLGVSAVPALVLERWFLAGIPIVYIAAVTAISQGEVEGGKRQTGLLAIALVLLVLVGIFSLNGWGDYDWHSVLPFAGLFGMLVLPAFAKAAQDPSPTTIQKAVKTGVLSLIVLDAAIAAGFAGWPYGLAVLGLLPLSMALARLFAVT
ncbi:UbiA-like protein EboC [Oscillatoria sp. CS-180]|uniref:UbiA-like protein EboC n=1 Tax=Oscillatoria sp. CS-180 TaxID=3021720 RepID=UPI00232DE65D|nr:UbiA-like protein EboC [Oscillatoria sp. CS-180]MDB9528024.1 UbiA-like protein EboC [Oscillatoria sp. CS-180]